MFIFRKQLASRANEVLLPNQIQQEQVGIEQPVVVSKSAFSSTELLSVAFGAPREFTDATEGIPHRSVNLALCPIDSCGSHDNTPNCLTPPAGLS